jgi:glycine oxidase
MPSLPSQHIVIIGAGPVGLCCALAMADAGYRVTVLDNGKRGAGWASGGMLGAVYETLEREDVPRALTEFAFESLAIWRVLIKEVGIDAVCDNLFLAHNIEQAHPLYRQALQARAESQKVRVPEFLRATAAWRCSTDITVNPRATLLALRKRCVALQIVFYCGQAESVKNGCVILTDGSLLQADKVIVAAGQGGSELANSLPELAYIAPVKGQMLAVAGGQDLSLTHTIRLGRLYLLPRGDQIIIGATSNPNDQEPLLFDLVAQNELHQEAIALWPALASAPIVESWSGFRPMTPDGLPMFGPSSMHGVYLATGTYRNGWLLAPAIAQALVDMVGPNAKTMGDLQPFSPQRFPI